MKKIILSLLLATIILIPSLSLAAEYNKGSGDSGLIPADCLGQARDCDLCDVVDIIIKVSDRIIAFSGVVALLMFVGGGLLLIANYGNEAWIKRGKEAIIAAVVGILIVFLAWSAINMIILSLYGGEDNIFTNFTGKSSWSGPCSQQ